MITGSAISITGYSPEYQPSIRKILTKISWAEQYIVGMENTVGVLIDDPLP